MALCINCIIINIPTKILCSNTKYIKNFNTSLETSLSTKYNKGAKREKYFPTLILKNEYSLEERLQHEEEIIRLKTKIAELESVTNLYRNHLFKLNEKCQKYEEQLANLNK